MAKKDLLTETFDKHLNLMREELGLNLRTELNDEDKSFIKNPLMQMDQNYKDYENNRGKAEDDSRTMRDELVSKAGYDPEYAPGDVGHIDQETADKLYKFENVVADYIQSLIDSGVLKGMIDFDELIYDPSLTTEI